MTIPENQLETWANPASQDKFIDAHESIRKALDNYNWSFGKPDYRVYLQGSYKNSTTTRKNSDVDVVVQLNSAFREDLSNLNEYEKALFKKDHKDATYTWDMFRDDILKALRQKDSFRVNVANKCIKVETPYLHADVVACMQHRLYKSYGNSQNGIYIEGMTFKPLNENRWIVNYPKQHIENGEKKSQNTDGWYKKAVRMFKNSRLHLVEKGVISKELAPSYFVECLLYNVPNSKFEKNHWQVYYNILDYLYHADLDSFKCQNEINDLFGDSPEQWSRDNAKTFINKTINLWNNWGK